MTTARSTGKSTLLPYLQGSSTGAALKLSLVPAHYCHGERAYPFDVLDDTGPVSRLVEADFVTDAGASLKRVVLQVQKDRYALAVDELHPLSNLDVDAAWRDALASRHVEEEFSNVLLSCQLDPQGNLAPLEPLFFCREHRVFFHPVCPACGIQLELCTDDQLLTRFGLACYSRSLKRYLHCRSCTSDGTPQFYVYDLDHSDHLSVKDRWSLIEQFRLVDAVKNRDSDFPCAGCLEHEACYGPKAAARERIVPFSFYPFYFLVEESPSLNAVDFLHLVSGAEFDEVAECLDAQRTPGRVAKLKTARECGIPGDSLFHRDDDRSFLEILLLKLSLLRDLLHQLLARPELRRGRIRSDRIWVRIPPGGSALSDCWHFKVEILGEVSPPVAGSRAVNGVTPVSDLGLFWFQALCQNARVCQRELFEALLEWLALQQGQAPSPSAERPSCLSPEQIYWHPGTRCVRDEWRGLWDRACEPGYQLLKASRKEGAAFNCQELIEAIDELRLEVKALMFSVPPQSAVETGHVERKDEVVARAGVEARMPAGVTHASVQTIMSRLMEMTAPNAALEPVSKPPADDEARETVVLSAKPGQEPAVHEVGLDETCIRARNDQALPPAPTPAEGGENFLDTLRHAPRTISAQSQQQDEIALLETLLGALPARGESSHRYPEKDELGCRSDSDEEREMLDETILPPTPPGRPRPKG